MHRSVASVVFALALLVAMGASAQVKKAPREQALKHWVRDGNAQWVLGTARPR